MAKINSSIAKKQYFKESEYLDNVLASGKLEPIITEYLKTEDVSNISSFFSDLQYEHENWEDITMIVCTDSGYHQITVNLDYQILPEINFVTSLSLKYRKIMENAKKGKSNLDTFLIKNNKNSKKRTIASLNNNMLLLVESDFSRRK